MFFDNLNIGATRWLHGLLKEPLSFDSIKFINKNIQHLSAGPSDINDLFKLAELFEGTKRAVWVSTPQVIHQLSSSLGLIGLDGVLADRSKLPIQISFNKQVDNKELKSDALCIDIINQQLERMYESFRVSSSCAHVDSLTNEANNLVAFYLLSEHVYLVLSGMARVSIENNVFTYSTNEKYFESYFKRKWFANFWEQQSSIASFANINFLEESLPVSEASNFIDAVSEVFLDKTFSINSNYLPVELEVTEGFKMMRLITRSVALLFYCKIKLGKDFAEHQEFNELGIKESELKSIKSINDKLISSDKIFGFSSDRVSLINPCISFNSRKLIEKFSKTVGNSEFDKKVGDFYENRYIREYIKSLSKVDGRYVVHGEIRAHDIYAGNKDGDIDLLVEDKVANRFLFIQVKYIRNAGKPFLRGDVEYLTNSHIQKGIDQLSSIKQFQKEGRLKGILEDLGVSNCTSENSIYILLSNISNIDFQEVYDEGVVLYEWNTFRNLLQDGRCNYGRSDDMSGLKEWRYHDVLPIENPGKVIDILMKYSPALNAIPTEDIFDSRYVNIEYTVSGVKCISYGLGV